MTPLTAMVGPDGGFEIRGVERGSYHLTASSTQGRMRTLGRLPIEVTSGDVDGLVFSIGETFEIAGSVRVEGEPKAALPAGVLLLAPPEVVLLFPLASTVGQDGAFRVEGVGRDHYRLNCYGLPEGTYLKSARVGDQEILEKGLDLSEAVTGPVVEIILSAKAGVVEGQAQAGNQPAPGAMVTLIPEPVRPNQPHLYKQVSADQNGRFRITSVAPGDYKLYAWAEELDMAAYLDPEFVKPLEGSGARVTVREHSREQVELTLVSTGDVQR